MRPEAWMQAAGLGTWLVTLLPSATAFARGDLPSTRALAFAVAALAFLAAFVLACRTPAGRRRVALAARVAQALAGIAMVWSGQGVVTAAIFVVVASQLPGVVPARVAIGWIVVQTAVIASRFDAWHLGPTLASCAVFAGFQVFALATASLAASERRARGAAAEHSRTLERLRVARDLHDTLGHHLTALGMQLEVAAHLADGRAKEHVERAHAIGRLLLADVRAAVGDLRESRPLGATLRGLVEASAGFDVHLDLADGLDALAGEPAYAILRAVQEVITNAARHADARNLWIAITADRSAIRLHARDDGRRLLAGAAIRWGLGLTGMAERFGALGGGLDVRRGAAGGFELVATVPRGDAVTP